MRELSISTKNLKLAALTSGDNSNAPVIALHGWLDNAASYIPIAPYLDHLRLIALDFPGHGKSEHRKGANAYHFIDYAADVILAAERLGLEKFDLLGHSLGAGIAALVASAVPEKINRLALVEGLAPFTGKFENTTTQLRLHIEHMLRKSRPARVYRSIDEAAAARQAAGDLSAASARLIAARNLMQNGEGGFIWRTDRCLRRASPIYLVEDHVIDYLSKIKCESLLIRSSRGIVKNWERLSGRERHIGHLQIIDIEGGHHCHMDAPELVATHLTSFFSTIDKID